MVKMISKATLDLTNDNIFIDRDPCKRAYKKEYELVKKDISITKNDENAESGAHVILFHGFGGIGKTKLLEELKSNIERGNDDFEKAKVVYYDFKNGQDNIEVLNSLKELLEDKYKFKFPLYEYGHYFNNKINGKKSEMPKREALVVRYPLFGIAVEVSAFLASTATGGLAAKVLDLAYTWFKNRKNKKYKKIEEKVKLANNRNDCLTSLFVLDLEENLKKEKTPLIIMFDTYERLVNEMSGEGNVINVDKWIRGTVDFENGLIPKTKGVLWVIAGREELRWEDEGKDETWKDSLYRVPLEKFDEPTTVNYLKNYLGVNNDKLCKELYKFTDGVPLYLDLCAQMYHRFKRKYQEEPTKSVFGKNTDNLIERFEDGMGPDIKPIVQVLCCLSEWTDEMALDVARKVITDFDEDLYTKIKKFSFIEKPENKKQSDDKKKTSADNKSSMLEIYGVQRIVRDVLLKNDYFTNVRKNTIRKSAIDFCKGKLKENDVVSSEYIFYLQQLMKYAFDYYTDDEELKNFYLENIDGHLQYLSKCGRETSVNIIFKDSGFYERAKNSKNKLLLAEALYSYSYFLNDAGNYPGALNELEAAIEIFKEYDNEQYFWARLDKVNILINSENSQDAYNEVISLVNDYSESENIDLELQFAIYNAMINVMILMKEYEVAEYNIRHMMKDWESPQGESNFQSLILRGNLSIALYGQKDKLEEAIIEAEKYVNGCEEWYEEDAFPIFVARKQLAKMYYDARRFSDYILLCEKIKPQQIVSFGENHSDTIKFMNILSYAYWEMKEYDKALEWFGKAEEQGDSDTKYYLAEMYYYGEGVERDINKAFYLYKQATEEGNDKAKLRLGVMYLHGEGTKRDTKEGLRLIKKAAENGIVEAQRHLADFYFDGIDGIGIKQNYNEAFYWYEKAANQNDADAQFRLAEMYMNGYGVDYDEEKAFEWVKKAAENGHEKAIEIIKALEDECSGEE